MSDLLDEEKSPSWETRLSLHIKMHLCFNHISDLLRIRLVFTLKLSTACINQCNIRDKPALVICNILIICNLNMALHLKPN